ncbi:uncharacterized protein LOC127705448 [Mytilus californianus]|uniref:uncharacterized protein LOC127705448 n=1 Tax=Mytilus californianus TaxID=6549 RepID=UPI002247E4E5|nr:uncharacterized protein LOC127705448 [Mytilus californianus]
MSSSILCGPCQYEDNIKGAKKWCTDCEDGYCEDCEKVHRSTKMSRNHTLISIADYQKIKDVSVKQNCEDHGKRFDLYCSTHDKALYISCVNQHKSCPDVSPLEEAARDAKQSTAFADVEDTIKGALENIEICIKDQESTRKQVENQEQMIRKNIKEIREKINKQLNVLEQKLINDLSVKSAKCKSSLEKTLNQLNVSDKKLIQLKEETQKMKKFASDVQVFLGTREVNIIVAKETETITRTINAALHFKIEAELDLNISSLLNRDNEMGKIFLQEIPTGLQFKDAKIDQAQKQVSVSLERGFRDLRLQLKQKLKILRKKNEISINVTGCLTLPNGHVLIAVRRSFDEHYNSYLIEYNKEGNHINDIRLSKHPFDLTSIDSDRIAITYGNVSPLIKTFYRWFKLPLYVEIKNITHDSSIKIQLNNSCWGISHQDGRLYVIVEEEGILVADVSGNILNTLRINTCNVKYTSTSKDIICYSDDVHNSVHCCNMEGKEIWVFQQNSNFRPAGLSVGHNNDIFVVGCASNNITLIHHNGTESKILLTAADGLNEPKTLHYDKNGKTLLVCDKTNAALYNVVLNI